MSNKINQRKINKGKMKNYLKRKELISKNGSATAETVLIIAIVLVIILTVFYPTLRNIITETLSRISVWYSNALSNIGIF